MASERIVRHPDIGPKRLVGHYLRVFTSARSQGCQNLTNDPNAHPVHEYGTIITDENHPRNPRHRTIEQEFGQSYRAIGRSTNPS
jgi:hypothetical protein